MSYLTELRKELIAIPLEDNCCRRAALCGMMLGKAERAGNGAVTLAVNPETAEFFASLLEKTYHVVPQKSARGRLTMLTFVSRPCEKYLQDAEQGTELIPRKCGGCTTAFLRGLFLAVGRAEDPERVYRLEFFPSVRADLVLRVLRPIVGELSLVTRRTESLYILRNSTGVEDFLMHVGAKDALFQLMNKKIEHQFRNDANRVANCEAGNIGKAVNGSLQQVEVLSRLEKEGFLSSLPPELEEVARLRLSHPEMSIGQLCGQVRFPISKSGMSHRLSRLMEVAQRILEQNIRKEER